ncbi:MAG: hypothetical protein AAF183_17555 [Pseudomonadota bacterium]
MGKASLERFPDEPHDGRVFRTLTIIDDYTKEALPRGRNLRMRLPGDG